MKEFEFDLLINDTSTATVKTTDPAVMFKIINSLKENGQNPKFRIYDEELKDKTCWQF